MRAIEFPIKLYKYKAWPNDYTKELIEKNEFYMNSIEEFNDPFEMIDCIYWDGTPEEYTKLRDNCVNEAKRRGEDIEDKILKEFEAMEKSNDPHKYMKIKDLIYKTRKNNSGVFCMSGNPTNVLMWSHYAASHKGICLEFETNLLREELLRGLFPVTYSEKYPEKIGFFEADKHERIMRQFLTKAKWWEYEDEYRFLFSNSARKKIPFEGRALKGIICGCEMSEKNMLELIKILEKRENKTKLYQMKKKIYEFGLEIEMIDEFGIG